MSNYTPSRSLNCIEIILLTLIISLLSILLSGYQQIPSQKAKISEAIVNVQKMAQGAKAYYLSSVNLSLDEEGMLTDELAATARLPSSTGPIPWDSACYFSETPEAHDPQYYTWQSPTWRALNFSIDRPFYYSYSFMSQGTTFTARAQGDLNCDAVKSLFEITGSYHDGQFKLSTLFMSNPYQ